MHQSEQILEDNLIKQLKTLGYKYVNIPDETTLLSNLKTQLEQFNNISLSEKEYQKNARKFGNVPKKLYLCLLNVLYSSKGWIQ